tara:strand:+ start:97 stop:510 length:414 start_codon:yes stop_codon:yes gene_type:complete
MITWMATKLFLKKAWAWLKRYWFAPFIVVYTLVLWFVFDKKNAAYEILKVRNENYEKEISILNESHRKEIEKRDKILQEYTSIVDEIEKKYREDSRTLTDKKKKEIKKIVESNINNPEEIAKRIGEEYGFLYVGSDK